MKTTYLVAGYRRTGTSMMMKALSEGGLEMAYSEELEATLRSDHEGQEYNPNPGGYWEVEGAGSAQHFPRGLEGSVIKVIGATMNNLDVMPGGYRVVIMRRSVQEVYHSHLNLKPEVPEDLIENLDYQMMWWERSFKNRMDVRSVTVLWYRDVVEEPKIAFQQLKDNGWPIDVDKAAAVVDPKLCRHKEEDLLIRKATLDEEPHILIGIGKHDLVSLMANAAETGKGKRKLRRVSKALAFGRDLPRYRPERLCSRKEIEAFARYVQWAQDAASNE